MNWAAIAHELRFRWRRQVKPGTPSLSIEQPPLVSLVAASKRPARLQSLVDIARSQTWGCVELIVVANVENYRTRSGVLELDSNVTLVDLPHASLGVCLNAGLEASSGLVVAKIDDDDLYSAHYVTRSMEGFLNSDAGVVGQKSNFVYLAGSDKTYLRFPGNENMFVGRLAGGTIMAKREVAMEIRFGDLNVGEDGDFIRRSERAGHRIWSGVAGNYLQIRDDARDDHAWTFAEQGFLTGATFVASGLAEDLWVRP